MLRVLSLAVSAAFLFTACGEPSPDFTPPVQPRAVIGVGTGDAARVLSTGFGDSTLRQYSGGPLPSLRQIAWGGAPGPEPVGSDGVGVTRVPGLGGAWDLARTSSSGLVVSGRLDAALVFGSVAAGAFEATATFRQGARVRPGAGDAGSVLLAGLERPGPVSANGGWVGVGGADALGLFRSSPPAFAAADGRYRGADDLVLWSLASGPQVILTRCVGALSGALCAGALDPGELLVLERVGASLFPRQRIALASSTTACGVPDCAPETLGAPGLLGDGHLATATSSSGAPVLVTAWQGSAMVMAFAPDPSGRLRRAGRRRVAAPWQDPLALPAPDGAAASTSTSAPVRIAALAATGDRVFVAAENGAFVQTFALGCLDAALDDPACLVSVCLDEAGACAGPSSASPTPSYPTSLGVHEGRLYVGLDVLGEDGRTTSRIAVLELGVDGALALLGFVDA